MGVQLVMTHPATPPAPAHPAAVEASTVVRAQRGDDEARNELARSCQRQAFRYALHLIGNPEDARDVAQDATLRFFASLGRFDASRPVRPWLLRIVRNLIRDRARRRRVRAAEVAQPVLEDLILEPVDPAPDPEATTARREMQVVVWQALLELTLAHREVLALRDYMDLSYDEIAVALKIPRGTVMSRLHRARHQLRDLVLERLGQRREVPDA
jgi:RNA polymerase sigma-70 factor (ECF subfamily)